MSETKGEDLGDLEEKPQVRQTSCSFCGGCGEVTVWNAWDKDVGWIVCPKCNGDGSAPSVQGGNDVRKD